MILTGKLVVKQGSYIERYSPPGGVPIKSGLKKAFKNVSCGM